MKRVLVGLIAVAIACSGCGGDSTGPTAGGVTGIFGDNSSTLTGGTLTIGFTVLNPDGFPLPGARVTWTVTPTASATVTPPSGAADTAGVVSTLVRVGATVGTFTVTARVNGVDPVTFHLAAIDPCEYLAPYALGQVVSASLARTDCKLNDYFYDFYRLDLPAGQNSIRIGMNSSTFDAYVELFTGAGLLVGSDDDIDPGVIQNARLDIILGQGGTYVIGANSYDTDTVGSYTLTTVVRPTSLTACAGAWVTAGVTIVDTLNAGDCNDNGSYLDYVWLYAASGSVLELAQRSSALNPVLQLFVANFSTGMLDSVVANNDSAAGNTNAFISYTVPADGLYQIRLRTASVGETGEYTFAFSPPSPSPAKGATTVLRLPPFRHWRAPKDWKATP